MVGVGGSCMGEGVQHLSTFAFNAKQNVNTVPKVPACSCVYANLTIVAPQWESNNFHKHNKEKHLYFLKKLF